MLVHVLDLATGACHVPTLYTGVFTELIQKFGVKGAHFREFYTMDEESFEAAKPLYVFPCWVARTLPDSCPSAAQVRPHFPVPVVKDGRCRATCRRRRPTLL